jgi:arylsulfatase A-like enzyme
MLMQWPGVIVPGAVYGRPVISFDISATVLAAAGADATHIDGVDVVPFVLGQNNDYPHTALFWRSRTMSNNYAARVGDWKFVHSTEGDANPGPKQRPAEDMLFYLPEDIGEQKNLAAQQPEKLAELRRLYETWSSEVDAECQAMGLQPKFPKTARSASATGDK